MEKEVIWTDPAKSDLQGIYEFTTSVLGEEKAFELVEKLVNKADILYQPHTGGIRYINELHPEIDYKKLIEGHHLIVFREIEGVVYVNRVSDSRQNPEKLKL